MKINTEYLYDLFIETSKNNKLLKLRTKNSLIWFNEIIQNTIKKEFVNQIDIFGKRNLNKRPTVGDIITFNYLPEHKKTLKYYDKFPLVLIVSVNNKGFVGINFHYLEPKLRLILMDKIYKNQKIFIENDRLKINSNYMILKNNKTIFPYIKPCIKMYKMNNIMNFLYRLKPEEWDMALFIPTEKFMKEAKETVWEDSKKIIKRSIK